MPFSILVGTLLLLGTLLLSTRPQLVTVTVLARGHRRRMKRRARQWYMEQ